jgi:exonuclease III
MNKLLRWDELHELDADIALLQECPNLDTCGHDFAPSDAELWGIAGWEQRGCRTAVVRMSDRVGLGATIATNDLAKHSATDLPVSRDGTIAAARVAVEGVDAFIAVSVYAPWERYFGAEKPVWADGSAHRILSDLSPLLWYEKRMPVIAAGDWNIYRGYGDKGYEVTAAARYDTVFARASALGLHYIGPQGVDGTNVPTFRGSKPADQAQHQVDFVFASESIADRVSVQALNATDSWGPSDHCRVVIDVRA